MMSIMIKRILAATYIALMFSLIFTGIVLADGGRVIDRASLFSKEQVDELDANARYFENATGATLLFVTTADAEGKSSMEYLDDLMFDYGYGRDNPAIGYLIDMDNRRAHITTSGEMIRIFSDSSIEQINDQCYDYLVAGDYYGAANRFYVLVTRYYENRRMPVDKSTPSPLALIISGLTGLAGGGITVRNRANKYGMKNPAPPYQFRARSSFALLNQADDFVSSRITSIPIAQVQNSSGGFRGGSSHTSSGGGSFGGGSSRRF